MFISDQINALEVKIETNSFLCNSSLQNDDQENIRKILMFKYNKGLF